MFVNFVSLVWGGILIVIANINVKVHRPETPTLFKIPLKGASIEKGYSPVDSRIIQK